VIEQPAPPIMLEPGLRYAGQGATDDGRLWIKFVNHNQGRVRQVTIFVVAPKFTYHYAIRDKATDTIIGYEGPFGDPERDEAYIWGTRSFE
jgi:hypothetical protein